MEKSRAIELLKMAVPIKALTQQEYSDFIEAVNMGMDALKTQLLQKGTTKDATSDTISRQAVIDLLKQMRKDGNMVPWEGKNVFARIRELPPAQPEPPWILCSEKMPEEHEWLGTKKFGTTISDEVYVTFENEKGERFCRHLSFQNGKLNSYDQSYMDVWHKGSKPIAWMPLPEEYKGSKQ